MTINPANDCGPGAHHKDIVILGLGNLLCGDDAFGVLTLEKLYEKYDFPAYVSCVDGGTQGQSLYGIIENAPKLLIFDAVKFGRMPGSLDIYENSAIPTWLGLNKAGPHQNSFAEVLALATLTGNLPHEMILIGLEPENIAFGSAMGHLAQSGIADGVKLAEEILKKWHVPLTAANRRKKLLHDEILQRCCPGITTQTSDY